MSAFQNAFVSFGLSPGIPRGQKKGAKSSGCGGACPTRTGRWEIRGGRTFALARIMLPAPCGWDSRLYTDPLVEKFNVG